MAAGDQSVEGEDRGEQLYGLLRTALLTGVAVVVPILITIYVLTIAVGILTQILEPFVSALQSLGVPGTSSQLFTQGLAVTLLTFVTLGIGVVATFRRGQQAITYFDVFVERLPGVGGIYKSFRKMSDVLLESDTENFQSVVLVEFPIADIYTIGFKTTETPPDIEAAADRDDMVTLFLPLAPNPVMGGHLAHVPREYVTEVDMSIEEGMRTVVTTGVAVGGEQDGLSQHEMVQLGGLRGDEGTPSSEDTRDRR
jgi:uncharacterized membrane protein